MSNLHLLLDEANKHTPKGFDNVGAKNFRPWKDELSESTYTENFQLPRAINFVDGTVAAPTSVNGDIYVLTGAGVIDPSWGLSTFGDWTRATNTIFTPITPIKGALCYDDTASQWKEFDGAAWISHDANATNLAIANITATNLDVTSDTGTDATVPAATVSDAGLMTAAKFNEVVANNAKVTNVSTDLTEGTTTNTTVAVNSSDGLNALLLAASTTRAGVMTKAKFDEVVANNAKVSFPEAPNDGNDYTRKNLGWSIFSGGDNIYTASLSLTANRTVTLAGFELTFLGDEIITGLSGYGGDGAAVHQMNGTNTTSLIRGYASSNALNVAIKTHTTTGGELILSTGGSATVQLIASGNSFVSGGNFGVGTNSPTQGRLVVQGASATLGSAAFFKSLSNVPVFEARNNGKCLIYGEGYIKSKSTLNGNIMFSAQNSSNLKALEIRDDRSIGFHGVVPTARATTSGVGSTFVANTSGIVDDSATFDGYTIGQVIVALRQIGILT